MDLSYYWYIPWPVGSRGSTLSTIWLIPVWWEKLQETVVTCWPTEEITVPSGGPVLQCSSKCVYIYKGFSLHHSCWRERRSTSWAVGKVKYNIYFFLNIPSLKLFNRVTQSHYFRLDLTGRSSPWASQYTPRGMCLESEKIEFPFPLRKSGEKYIWVNVEDEMHVVMGGF